MHTHTYMYMCIYCDQTFCFPGPIFGRPKDHNGEDNELRRADMLYAPAPDESVCYLCTCVCDCFYVFMRKLTYLNQFISGHLKLSRIFFLRVEPKPSINDSGESALQS